MILRRLGATFASWLVLGPLAPIACSNATPSDYPGGGDDGPGVEVDPWRAREGTVSIVGASPSVPVSNNSWSGYREGSKEFVRCTHDPAGIASDRPGITIEAGSTTRTHVSVALHDIVTRGPVNSTGSASNEELPKFSVEVSLSPELEEGAYVYGLGVDSNVEPPEASTCALEISEFTEDELVGTLKCEGLLPLEGSPDRPITNAPYPKGDVSIAFDCPLVITGDEPSGGTGGATGGSGGSSGGTGGTGGGGTTPSCHGTPTSCSLLSGSSCSLTLGCVSNGECGGSATSCYYLFNSYSCYAQDGCYWSNGDCKGYASSCFSQPGEYSCTDQDGCNWSESCEGVATSCSTFSSASGCGLQPGCYWL